MAIERFYNSIPKYMNKIYNDLHNDLKTAVSFDCQLSGSTLTTLVFDRNTVFCANAGDSRAVLYSHHYVESDGASQTSQPREEDLISDTEQSYDLKQKLKAGKLKSILKIMPMSVDHKPSMPVEMKRIN